MGKQGKKSRILCIDDNRKNLQLLKLLLKRQGYSVDLAQDGLEALQKIKQNPPDLILLDIAMPKVSGLEVLGFLRREEKTRLIPVILLTALTEEKDRIKGIEAGCDDFITKPFDRIELIARVKSLLRMSFYRRELDEKEKFNAIINEVADGVVVCRADGRITKMNVSAQRYLGNTEGGNPPFLDFIGQRYEVSLSKKELKDVSRAHKKFMITRAATEQYKPLYLETNMDVIRNPLGEVTDILYIMRDVTQEREDAILKQDFLGFISHKLRTPIAAIEESSSLLREGALGSLTDKQANALRIIANESEALKNLVEKLLGFVLIKGKLDESSQEWLRLDKYLKALGESAAKASAGKDVVCSVNCPGKQPILYCKKYYLDIIMGNLVENALKFNDKKIVRIKFIARRLKDGVRIQIADNGRGIPPEEQGRIFQQFYQVERFYTGTAEGIGLGLAMAKRIVDMLGGEISVKSALGKGANFTITLPDGMKRGGFYAA